MTEISFYVCGYILLENLPELNQIPACPGELVCRGEKVFGTERIYQQWIKRELKNSWEPPWKL